MRIYEGGVPANDAARFELTNALQNGRRGQTYDTGNVRLRYPGVFLKKIQNCGISFVDHSVIMP